ncbi:hypothetical protein GCM10011386_22930 [Parapedobacter defluvii]|uniref:Uncharacterized protein n=1 Tax=Parapedobacter defluvii TaxID=2045106 RepID=A0ABQ1LV92_9SPHI|nr:hypothetical protein [Parapedobacter defluvii]RQP14923.1 MAG: hypothetical protein EAS52_16535 [Parapedobacter sp.]GGC30338.1 hypothetical protein GCM10011386_22930 [Parapedobacter defluvii]
MTNTKLDSPSAYMKMFGLLAKSNASFHKKQNNPADYKQLNELIKQAEPIHLNCFEAHLFSLLALD